MSKIENYFQGATIHNLVINGNMNRSGTENYGTAAPQQETHAPGTGTDEQGPRAPRSYTDEQVARALEAICGEGRAVDQKRKFAGVYWGLRWYCGYPVAGTEFCERVNGLPFKKGLAVTCDYNNVRRLILHNSFMQQDAREMDNVKVDRADEDFFMECKTVVQELVQELERLP